MRVKALSLFDEKATTYDDFCKTPLGHFVDTVEHDMMASMMRPVAGEKAIDLGCGTGSYTNWLRTQGLSVVGVDISQKMLEVARRKGDDGSTFVQADLAHLPFDDHTFDLALCHVVLEFTTDPEAILEGSLRILKTGGRLVVGCINKLGLWGQKYALRGQEDPTSVYHDARFFTMEEMKKIIPGKSPEMISGLYTGPDEFTDIALARQFEQLLQDQLREPGYFVCRWDV